LKVEENLQKLDGDLIMNAIEFSKQFSNDFLLILSGAATAQAFALASDDTSDLREVMCDYFAAMFMGNEL